MLPLTLAPAAFSLARGIFSRKKKQKARPDANLAAFDRSVASEEKRGNRLTREHENRVMNYDPSSSLRASNQAAMGDWREEFGEGMESLHGNQVARGRLDSGYGFQDEDRYVRGMEDRLARQFMHNSNNAENLKLRNQESMGAAGDRSRDRSMEARWGRYATERDRKDREKASKRSMIGSIGGSLIGAAGSYLGNRGGG